MTELDRETNAAIDALEYRLKLRDEAVRDGLDYPDAGPFALEFLTALRGQGWRPTPARASALPKHARDEILRDLRTDMEARAAAARAAKEAPIAEGAA